MPEEPQLQPDLQSMICGGKNRHFPAFAKQTSQSPVTIHLSLFSFPTSKRMMAHRPVKD
jgi:hypothetical protein